jgi:RNA polymerase sigma-70 factor (ECF subfamily)
VEKEPTDKQLMKQIAVGDEQAFEQLYVRYKNSLYFYLNVLCTDTHAAEDIFQETWATVFRSASYTDSGQFKAWLFHIARSRLSDYYRKQPNHAIHCNIEESDKQILAIVNNDTLSTEELIDLLNGIDQVFATTKNLPLLQQEAFSLKWDGFTFTEIAKITGVNKETAKSRVRYALARLIHQLRGRR